MTKKIGPGGPSRRSFLTGTAMGAAALGTGVNLFNINHAWSQEVLYDGQTFDAGGAILNVGEWPGFWEENIRKLLINDFEKEFNCKIQYDSSWPWYPKFVANGPKKPPLAITNWNLPEMFKTAGAGDYFLSIDEIKPNVPNTANVWPFAYDNGVGVTWAFGRYCYVYRTDRDQPAPTKFADFWEDRYKGKRGTYVTSNTLQMDFFLASCALFGKDQYDLDAGYAAMKKAAPMKISDFTGNMQALVERGEVSIAVEVDGEVYMQMAKGVPVAPFIWDEVKPILTQTKTISRYSEPMQKKLAFALLNKTLDPKFQTAFGETFFLRPTNKEAVVPSGLAKNGVTNTAESTAGLSTWDWAKYLASEDDIVETVNGIFAG